MSKRNYVNEADEVRLGEDLVSDKKELSINDRIEGVYEYMKRGFNFYKDTHKLIDDKIDWLKFSESRTPNNDVDKVNAQIEILEELKKAL